MGPSQMTTPVPQRRLKTRTSVSILFMQDTFSSSRQRPISRGSSVRLSTALTISTYTSKEACRLLQIKEVPPRSYVSPTSLLFLFMSAVVVVPSRSTILSPSKSKNKYTGMHTSPSKSIQRLLETSGAAMEVPGATAFICLKKPSFFFVGSFNLFSFHRGRLGQKACNLGKYVEAHGCQLKQMQVRQSSWEEVDVS